jgi:hypothetical protein
MPETISYDAATLTLHIGEGAISPVQPEVWDYEASGTRVVRHSFGYRKRVPDVRRSSALNDTGARRWEEETTNELLDLLQILTMLVNLESAQRELLDEIMSAPLITVPELKAVGVLPVPFNARRAPRRPHLPKPSQRNCLR